MNGQLKAVVLNLSWSVAHFQRLSTLVTLRSSIEVPNFVLGFAISRQNYLVKASARWPRRTPPWSPRVTEGPGLETLALGIVMAVCITE